jgi:hypothetical protein
MANPNGYVDPMTGKISLTQTPGSMSAADYANQLPTALATGQAGFNGVMTPGQVANQAAADNAAALAISNPAMAADNEARNAANGLTTPTTTPNTQTSDRYTQQAATQADMLKQQRDANAQAMAALKTEIENEYQTQMEERKAANAEAAKTEGALQFKLGQSGTNYAASQTSVNNLARLKSLDALTQQKNTLLAKAMASYNQDDLNAVKEYNNQINTINDKIDAAQQQKYTNYLAQLASDRGWIVDQFNMSKATAAAALSQSQFDFEKQKYQYTIDHPEIKTATKDVLGADGQMHSVLYNTDNGNTIKDLGVSESLVMDILKKYPDAGILPTDSLAVAENKFKTNSKIYADQVRPPVGAGGETGLTPGSISYYADQIRQGLMDINNVPAASRNSVIAELQKPQTMDYSGATFNGLTVTLKNGASKTFASQAELDSFKKDNGYAGTSDSGAIKPGEKPDQNLSSVEQSIQRKKSIGTDPKQIRYELQQEGFSAQEIDNSSVGSILDKLSHWLD